MPCYHANAWRCPFGRPAAPQVQFKPPLSTREAQFLQDISADRPPGY